MFFAFRLISILIEVLVFVVIIDVILPWIPSLRQNKLTVTINLVANIILAPVRTVLRNVGVNTPIDISPLIAIVALQLIRFIFRIILW